MALVRLAGTFCRKRRFVGTWMVSSCEYLHLCFLFRDSYLLVSAPERAAVLGDVLAF